MFNLPYTKIVVELLETGFLAGPTKMGGPS